MNDDDEDVADSRVDAPVSDDNDGGDIIIIDGSFGVGNENCGGNGNGFAIDVIIGDDAYVPIIDGKIGELAPE